MKVTLRLPTQDQYAFIEIESEVLSAEDAVTAYNDAMRLLKPQEGLPEKEMNRCVDEYMNTGTLVNGTELYAQMNEKQKYLFQTLKRHEKRNGYHDKKITN